MAGFKTYLTVFLLGILLLSAFIVFEWGLSKLFQVVLFLVFLVLSLMFAFFLFLTLYARSYRYSILLVLFLLISLSGLYFSYVWRVGYALLSLGFFMALTLFSFWYLGEPDLTLTDRFRSPEKLERMGRYRQAARKYEKAENYEKAAELYLKLGWFESAAWAYEKAGKYNKAAELYEMLYNKERDTYYLREAYDYWKKAGNLERAAKALEKYAEEEPWFWEDVAKLYEEIGIIERAKMAWKKALNFYLEEAKEEGVFWEDVGNIAGKLGMKELARDSYRKFLEYCLKEVKKDPMWWKHVAEAYEYLGEKDKAEEARRKYLEYRQRILQANEETSNFPD